MLKFSLFLLVTVALLIQGALSLSCSPGSSGPLLATGVLGQLDFDAHVAVDLKLPFSVAISPITKKIFVSETLQVDADVIVRFDNSALFIQGGVALDRIVKNSDSCSGANLKPGYHHLAFGNNDDLYISESLSHRVVRLADASSVVAGAPVFNKVFGQKGLDICLSTELNLPAGIFVDVLHNLLWVADSKNNKVKGFSLLDVDVDVSVNLPLLSLGSGRGCSASSLKSPQGVAVDIKGNVWVADTYNSRVLMFPYDVSKGLVSLSATVVLGQPSLTTCSHNLLDLDLDLDVDLDLDLLNLLGLDVDVDADLNLNLLGRALSLPASLALDDSYLYVLDRDYKRVMSFAMNDTKSFASSAFQVGQPSFTDTRGHLPSRSTFFGVNLAVDVDLGLFVADKLANRVLVFCSPDDHHNGGNNGGDEDEDDQKSSKKKSMKKAKMFKAI